MAKTAGDFQQPFEYLCQGLSTPQIHFLRAMADNAEQFCSQVCRNTTASSALYRVRNALEKNIIETVRKASFYRSSVYIVV